MDVHIYVCRAVIFYHQFVSARLIHNYRGCNKRPFIIAVFAGPFAAAYLDPDYLTSNELFYIL